VRHLQRVLVAVGQPTVVDGTLGYATQASLQAFQRMQGLPATGTLDAATVGALVLSRQGR
jgi:peptidoglycan hydrolase-like protein with peptidoglycan-binding domain